MSAWREFPVVKAKMRHFGSRGEKEQGFDGGEHGAGLERTHPVGEGDGLKGRREKGTVVRESGLKERERGGLDEGGRVFAVLG